MNINDVIKAISDTYPNRKPARYAQDGDSWYVFTENTVNNGKHLNTLIENSWFVVTTDGVLPTTPLDMPKGLHFKRIW
nr:hypothetical protein [Clostridia bacterium]